MGGQYSLEKGAGKLPTGHDLGTTSLGLRFILQIILWGHIFEYISSNTKQLPFCLLILSVLLRAFCRFTQVWKTISIVKYLWFCRNSKIAHVGMPIFIWKHGNDRNSHKNLNNFLFISQIYKEILKIWSPFSTLEPSTKVQN